MGEKDKILSGRPVDITDLNLALYGQLDPDVPPISMKQYLKLWPAVKEQTLFNQRKRLNAPVIMASTAGDNGKFFKNTWDYSDDKVWIDTPDGKMYFIPAELDAIKKWEDENLP